MSRAAAGAAAVLCFGGATALHAVQDRWPKPSIDRPELLYVRSPAAARRAFIGYQAMAADLYWIRAIQHFGQERLSPPTHARTYALLFPLLDLTTTLDLSRMEFFQGQLRFVGPIPASLIPSGYGVDDVSVGVDAAFAKFA